MTRQVYLAPRAELSEIEADASGSPNLTRQGSYPLLVSRRGEATLSPLPHAHLAHFQPLDAGQSHRQHQELPRGMSRSPGGDGIEEKGAAVLQWSG